jgi:hypothetical protein
MLSRGTFQKIKMDNEEKIISSNSKVISEHQAWLKSFDKQRLKKWMNLLKANPESAICEAKAKKLLSDQDIEIKPYENLSSGGPDFVCCKRGITFYVEITCVTKEKVAKKSGTNDQPARGSYYELMTDVFLSELCNKVPQCSNLGAPCVVAICTLHRRGGAMCFGKAAMEDLLTGTPHISMKFDPNKGRGVGKVYESTDLQDSAFIRLDKTLTGQIEFARNPISAVLLCSFGYLQMELVGALHPNPKYNFDRTLLPNIEFGELTEEWKETGELKVKWI